MTTTSDLLRAAQAVVDDFEQKGHRGGYNPYRDEQGRWASGPSGAGEVPTPIAPAVGNIPTKPDFIKDNAGSTLEKRSMRGGFSVRKKVSGRVANEIFSWGGERGFVGLEAVNEIRGGDSGGFVLFRGSDALGVVSASFDGDALVVHYLATKHRGLGVEMMRVIAGTAVKANKKIVLIPNIATEPFYKRIGFTNAQILTGIPGMELTVAKAEEFLRWSL